MPLCGGCHGKVHGLDFTHHRQLTKAALDVKKARGERVGPIPYGYRLAADGLHLEPDPSEQRTIARAKALRDAGLTVRRIAEDLARRLPQPRRPPPRIPGRRRVPAANPRCPVACSARCSTMLANVSPLALIAAIVLALLIFQWLQKRGQPVARSMALQPPAPALQPERRHLWTRSRSIPVWTRGQHPGRGDILHTPSGAFNSTSGRTLTAAWPMTTESGLCAAARRRARTGRARPHGRRRSLTSATVDPTTPGASLDLRGRRLE